MKIPASSREVAQGKGLRRWGDGESDVLILELKSHWIII